MAHFVGYIATSADGYIAGPGGSVDWLAPYEDVDYGYDAFVAEVTTIVMGRVTYEQVRGFGSWPYEGRQVIVLGSQPLDDPPDGVGSWPGDVEALAEALESVEGTVWILGGCKTLSGFLAAGVMAELRLFVMPLLLGDGIRLIGAAAAAVPLHLEDSQAFRNGAIELRYRVG